MVYPHGGARGSCAAGVNSGENLHYSVTASMVGQGRAITMMDRVAVNEVK